MSNEIKEWERGLQALITRAHNAEAEASEEIRYIEQLERFIDVSKELREIFRAYVMRPKEPIPFENPEELASRFAPNGPGAEALRRVANGSYQN